MDEKVKNSDNDIMVTVLCTAYNHGKYIRQCLDGIVSQEADFRYECIVHDDASSDDTPTIIKEYVEKYPDIIIPILQKENQYSKGINILNTYMNPIVKGKYVAFCEGDDFWIDTRKLQKQVDSMESHHSADFCVCTVKCVNENGEDVHKTLPYKAVESGIVDPQKFINIIHGAYTFQTSGYLIKSKEYLDYCNHPPAFAKVAPVGDWPMLLYFGNKANVLIISDSMSCYRMNVIGSFTERMNNTFYKNSIIYHNKMIKMMTEFDIYTNGKYSYEKTAFIERFMKYNFQILLDNHDYNELLKKEYKNLLKQESIKFRLYVWSSVYMKPLLDVYHRIRN